MDQQTLQNEVATAIQSDLPRMLRSDVTRISEMIAKYAGLPGTGDALESLVIARASMLELSASISGQMAPTMAGPGADSGPETATGPREPWTTPAQRTETTAEGIVVDAGGKAILLTDALVRANFVSSSGRAKAGIKAGLVLVDGAQVTVPTTMLEPGSYEIMCGESPGRIVVR